MRFVGLTTENYTSFRGLSQYASQIMNISAPLQLLFFLVYPTNILLWLVFMIRTNVGMSLNVRLRVSDKKVYEVMKIICL
jgi:hypothetical protein